MPRTKSAKKALRQSVTRRSQNLVRSKAYKGTLKNFRKLVVAGSTADASAMFSTLQKNLDKAAKSGAIAKNKASRLKSRAAHAIAKTLKASS